MPGEEYTISKIGKVSQSVDAFRQYVEKQSVHGVPTDRSYFDSLMKLEKKAEQVPIKDAPVKQNKSSLMDEVSKINKKVEGVQKASTKDLIAQTQDAISQIDKLRGTLSDPSLKIPTSVNKLLKGKLAGINENLKVAFAKAGLEYVPPEKRIGKNPIKSFLDMLANGQHNLERLGAHVDQLATSGERIEPTALLALQIKVGHIQQELEFFANLRNKGLESTKTLMNVQV